MTNEFNDLPSWEPERILDELARESGRSRARLDGDLRQIAGELNVGNHLNFEQMRGAAFSAEQQQHLNGCGFCQRLHAALHPSDDIIAQFRARLGEEFNTPAVHLDEASAAPSDRSLREEEQHTVSDWWRLAGVAASFAAVGASVIAVQLHRTTVPLASLPTAAQFTLAQSLVKEGQYPAANKVLLTAFEKGGIDGQTLYTVSEVLQTPSKLTASFKDLRRVLMQTNRAEKDPAAALVKLSTVQMKNGQLLDRYESLAAYLKTVAPQAPATEAFQDKFVAQLPPSMPKTEERD
jgi:hypothetical protein